MTEELDDTICPLCGKMLDLDVAFGMDHPTRGIWAQAHYLAHLVQQQASLITEQLRLMRPLHNSDVPPTYDTLAQQHAVDIMETEAVKWARSQKPVD